MLVISSFQWCIYRFHQVFKACENIYIKTCDTSSNITFFKIFPPPNCEQYLWPRPFSRLEVEQTLQRCEHVAEVYPWIVAQNVEFPLEARALPQMDHAWSPISLMQSFLQSHFCSLYWFSLIFDWNLQYWHAQLWIQGTASHTSVNLVSSGTSQLESSRYPESISVPI